MKTIIRHILIATVQVIILILWLSSCSTGIEGTKAITMGRAEEKILQPGPEQLLIDSVRVIPLSSWRTGKRFIISDDKASVIYEVYDRLGQRLHIDSIGGTVVEYSGVRRNSTPDGTSAGLIVFSEPATGNSVLFRSRKKYDEIGTTVWSDLPMMIDLDLLKEYRTLLRDRRLWIRTALWYDGTGDKVTGSKFIPVRILDILPGDAVFPLKVMFSDGTRTAFLPMNMSSGSSAFESRAFPSLFSLSDPKENYPDILPEIWTLICQGRVVPGMTKEECKLSLGNPKEVDTGHDWNNLVDFWRYSDGTFLRFQDGRLLDYRR